MYILDIFLLDELISVLDVYNKEKIENIIFKLVE